MNNCLVFLLLHPKCTMLQQLVVCTYLFIRLQVIPKLKLWFLGHQISQVSDLSTQFFSMGQLSNGGCERNKLWHKGSLGDNDDARTLNARIAHRKCTIPHSTMKMHRNMTSILVTALRNQPEAFASDLGDDQKRYLQY